MTTPSDTAMADPGSPPPPQPAAAPPRAGRDLPAAITVGVLLGGAVVASLFTQRWVYVGLASAAVMLAVFELTRALRTRTPAVPQLPLIVGAPAVLAATYAKGTEALVIATALLIIACVAWVAVGGGADPRAGAAGAAFATSYVVFLAGFAVLLAIPDDGPRRVITLIATVACSDTGGYVLGVLAGRHPMAPSVSPKKSWEGFAGSVMACALCGGLLVPLILHGRWWQGVVFGLAIVVAATLGDLAESAVKRDLGIKDMGTLLPGHGGVLDRIDALLFAAPVAWALLTAFVAWPS
jgi:phosphatidate cytidylyltransferase